MKIEKNAKGKYVNIKVTPIIQQKLNTPVIIKFLDAQHMHEQYPITFTIPSEGIRRNIPNGMWIKCRIQWLNGINENAWIEVIDSISDGNGERRYTAAFNEFNLGGLKSGAIAHDIESKHIMDFDIERFKQLIVD